MNSTHSNNQIENSHFLSNTQKVNKAHYSRGNYSINDEVGKSFLNSTINGSNYASNTDGRSTQKASRNTQHSSIHHQTLNAAKGMPPSQLTTGIITHHQKQYSVKTPTKTITGGHNYSGSTGQAAPLGCSTDATGLAERREDGMKICRGPFNVNCATSRDPQ